MPENLQDLRPGHHLSLLGHRGAWEAAIVNTLSPGDKVLMVETGHFATMWQQMAARWGVDVEFMPGDWRHGCRPGGDRAAQAGAGYRAHHQGGVWWCTTRLPPASPAGVGDIRAAIDKVGHPALLLVDTISSLGSIDFRHDEWKVDVTVSCSQKGFMLPPGLGFNAISEKARAAAKTNKMPRSYWDWEEMLKPNAAGFFPYTPATNLLYGLREAIAMLQEEGLDNVFARHKRLAAATRAAVTHWGLEVLCLEPAEYSPVLTAVLMPPGHDADKFRKTVLDNYNMSLGSGLTKLAGKVFRIGHLGECNELTLLGALVRRGDGAYRCRRAASGRRRGSRDAGTGRAQSRSNSPPPHLRVIKT